MEFLRCAAWHGGGILPSAVLRPTLLLALVAVASSACSSTRNERLDPAVVAMDTSVAPIYDDGELTLYEVKSSVRLPVIAPGQANWDELWRTNVEPFGRLPWVTNRDLEVQVSFTLSNLDAAEHVVEVLLDPWNEFGRYWPGLQVVDADNGELLPNLSGINERFLLPGVREGEASRITGTFTFDDMDEMAIDFATVMNIIENLQPPADLGETDPRVTYANHAFSRQNRSYNSPLVAPYRPQVIPGLVGFDFGLRTEEPANIALEVLVEVVDVDGKKLMQDSEDPALPIPQEQITVGSAG
jgi:hypothetical protein